jgi:hypothetical protein
MPVKLGYPTAAVKASKSEIMWYVKCFELRRWLFPRPAARSRKRPKLSSPKQSKRTVGTFRRYTNSTHAFNSWEKCFELRRRLFTGPLPEVESVRSSFSEAEKVDQSEPFGVTRTLPTLSTPGGKCFELRRRLVRGPPVQ